MTRKQFTDKKARKTCPRGTVVCFAARTGLAALERWSSELNRQLGRVHLRAKSALNPVYALCYRNSYRNKAAGRLGES